jgi:hypothetical protein
MNSGTQSLHYYSLFVLFMLLHTQNKQPRVFKEIFSIVFRFPSLGEKEVCLFFCRLHNDLRLCLIKCQAQYIYIYIYTSSVV